MQTIDLEELVLKNSYNILGFLALTGLILEIVSILSGKDVVIDLKIYGYELVKYNFFAKESCG